MTYHLSKIPKGVLGEVSKILEEVLELQDAEAQGCRPMMLWEMGDVILALQLLQETKFPGMSWEDLIKTANITRRVFESGTRGPTVKRNEYCKYTDSVLVDHAWLLLRSCRSLLKWNTYGTGYAVAKLGDEAKFHVWHTLFIQDETLGGIHSHRWNLESTVLFGSITNAVLREEDGKEFIKNGCGCGNGAPLMEVPCGLREVHREAAIAGETYTSKKGTPHQVIAFDASDSGTLTFVQKRERESEEDAFFYIKSGMDRSENPYETPLDLTLQGQEIVLFTLEKALEKWKRP